MRPTDLEIISLIQSLAAQCREHNNAYHHITPLELIGAAYQLIEKIEQNPS